MGDGNSFPFVVWLLLVILACKSIVLCKCSGKYIDIYVSLKITFFYGRTHIFSLVSYCNFLRVRWCS